MRRFLCKMGIWAGVLLVPMLLIEHYLQTHKGSLEYLVGEEVFAAVSNSKKQSGKSILILGDSVCYQLYPNYRQYSNAVSLSCNGALSVAAHSFLLKNYLSANVETPPDTVVLILTPQSLQNQLDRFAYHYLLKNFMNKEYESEFNEELWDRIRKIPAYWTASLPFIRVSNYSPKYNPAPDDSYALFSPVSRSYLTRIARMTDAVHARFFFLCAPVDAEQKNKWERVFSESEKMEEVPAGLMHEYTESASYLRDCFSDGVHFRPDCIPDDYFHLLHEYEP